MKTALSIIGVVFLLILVGGGALIGLAVYEGTKLDASSKAYVDDNIPPIISTWSKGELIMRESPQFRAATTDDELATLFTKFAELGRMQHYDGSKGSSSVNFTPADGMVIRAVYVVSATFQNGSAQIQVTLVQVNDEWQILGFRVDSPLFAR